jgi:hypothetical protein
MPANWDYYQTLNSGRIEWPKGDMTLSAGFTARWVEAWAVQGGGMGAGLDYRWTADSPGWIAGSFQAGPAVGIALLASRNSAGVYQYNWWFGVVVLQ